MIFPQKNIYPTLAMWPKAGQTVIY